MTAVFSKFIYFDSTGLCEVGEINPFRVAADHEQWEVLPPRPLSQHQAASASATAAPASAPAPVAHEGEFRKASRGDSRAAIGSHPIQQVKAEWAERRGGGSQQKAGWQAEERLLRSHDLDLRDTAVMHRAIGTHEGEAVWQGEDELEEA